MLPMSDSNMINEAQAEEVIAGIEDPAMRIPISLLTKSLLEYYSEHPTQLDGFFDLQFFVHALMEVIEEISGLVRGTTPVEYWFPDYPHPVAVDEARDYGPTGLRQGQAFNFAANQRDERVQAALLTLKSRADLKQSLLLPTVKRWKHHGPGIPPVPEAPARPFDFLFMVKAVAHGLDPGQPARIFFEAKPGTPTSPRDPQRT
jgi:hypothetical protein